MSVLASGAATVLAELRPGRPFLLTSHSRPDGDALGSLLALAELLAQRGCPNEIVLADPVPALYHNLPGVHAIRQERVHHSQLPDDAAAIILECDSVARTGMQGLSGRFLINIDHHASGRAFADCNWIDADAAAVGCMVYDLAETAQVTVTPDMATNLYSAILCDTAGFVSPATNARSLQIASSLALLGATPGRIAHDLYMSNPEGKMRLLGTSLTNMQRQGVIAWSWATLADLARVQATADDCDGVVNSLVSISGVEAAFFLHELPGRGDFRLSLRSKNLIDVSQIAESFGGGGHRVASGCTLAGPLQVAVDRVLERVRGGLC